MKNQLVPFVRQLGHEVEDCGALAPNESDDYPQFISLAAKRVSVDAEKGVESRAIVLGGSGQGEAIVANRFKHVRAMVYYGQPLHTPRDGAGRAVDIVALSREHNDSNVLALGARFISLDDAKEVIKVWLTAPYTAADRHARRLAQIESLEI